MLMLLFNISSVDKGITGRKIAIFLKYSQKTQFCHVLRSFTEIVAIKPLVAVHTSSQQNQHSLVDLDV
jgi:hypothetical protein